MIVINARFLSQKTTGVQRYAIEISNRLPQLINGIQIIFVAPKGSLINKNKLPNCKIEQFGHFKGHLWEQIDLVYFLKKKNNPILINFGGIGPIFYKNKITYLHDLAFKYYPKSFSFLFQKAYNTLIPISVKNSLKTITVSNYVKEDIKKNININNIEVVYAAQANHFKNLNLKREKYILAVSSLDPRKNFHRILEAYKDVDSEYKLIFVGAKSKAFSNIKIDNKLIEKNVTFTGYLQDSELIEYYNKASIFIYASLFEGFGIPPLEAQACACPCLVSNITSLPEVYGDSVEYCNPFSVEDIRNKLNLLINDKNKREILVKKGFENIKRYNWDSSVKKLVQIIEKELISIKI
ncbi:glycosyltransferase family 4 protein [Polaribacter vadi]|uniref:glycosyltransferase family 4 protein n=1 Tax=Polaribacter TaxID=52959 RepID=UPI001C0A24F4|nr:MULTISPECIES: glycosyltransferase family 1 protein [Polaribacter]MBU3010923.1 glycosyltransferase family 4 protein [Polaribacter vadi]MDO6740735.1 glycosyltransferase family 1 protein [Polaribacter sp. 1_MG-2023]